MQRQRASTDIIDGAVTGRRDDLMHTIADAPSIIAAPSPTEHFTLSSSHAVDFRATFEE